MRIDGTVELGEARVTSHEIVAVPGGGPRVGPPITHSALALAWLRIPQIQI